MTRRLAPRRRWWCHLCPAQGVAMDPSRAFQDHYAAAHAESIQPIHRPGRAPCDGA